MLPPPVSRCNNPGARSLLPQVSSAGTQRSGYLGALELEQEEGEELEYRSIG